MIQFADLHFGEGEDVPWGPAQDALSVAMMNRLIELEQGLDLVVLSGDQLTGLNIDENATKYWDKITGVLDDHRLPHTAILGNHDAEPYSASGGSNQSAPGAKTNRTELMIHDMKGNLSYSQLGPADLRPAVSAYVTSVRFARSDSVALQIVHLDSGGGGMVEEVFPAQIAWMNRTIDRSIPAIVFVHIPLEEFAEAVEDGSKCFGTHDDGVTPGIVNNGLFAALETTPVQAVFVGHDHLNDFCCNFGSRSISLCFGRHSGAGGYVRFLFSSPTTRPRAHELTNDDIESSIHAERTGFRVWISCYRHFD